MYSVVHLSPVILFLFLHYKIQYGKSCSALLTGHTVIHWRVNFPKLADVHFRLYNMHYWDCHNVIIAF